MPLPQDPMILLSLLNTRLRDGAPSLEALCRELQADPQAVCDTLAALGYSYDPAQKRFR